MGFGQDSLYRYVVYLEDKADNQFSLNNPSEFLSSRALQRRSKQGVDIDIRDLPISQKYIDDLLTQSYNVKGKRQMAKRCSGGNHYS